MVNNIINVENGNTTPVGFKHTEIGMLPKDWEVVQLVNVCKEIGDGIHATPIYSESGEYYFINGNNISDGRIFTDDNTKKVNTSEFLKHQKKLSKKTVLLSINGTIGNIAFYNGERLVLGKSAAYLTIKDNISEKFIYYIIQTSQTKRQFDDGMTGSTIKNLGLATIRQTIVPLPDIEEQKAIADVLSDTDALIIGFEKLIAKKQAIKIATMQQLMTGHTRLPGFNGAWRCSELKHLVSTPITDGPHMTPNFYDTGVPFLSVNNLVNSRIDLADLRYISKKDDELFSKKCKPKKGDVLLGKAASVGKVAFVEEEFDFNIWSPIALIRTNDFIDPKFLYYQLMSAYSVAQIMLFTNSSSQGNIGMGDIEKIEIRFPDNLKEQRRIATILSDFDAELATLERKLAKVRDIKQGMMQQLLTGRIRLHLDQQS